MVFTFPATFAITGRGSLGAPHLRQSLCGQCLKSPPEESARSAEGHLSSRRLSVAADMRSADDITPFRPQPASMTTGRSVNAPFTARTQAPSGASGAPHPRSAAGLKLLCGGHCDDVLQMAMERYAAIINGSAAHVGDGVSGTAAAGGKAAVGSRADEASERLRSNADCGWWLSVLLVADIHAQYAQTGDNLALKMVQASGASAGLSLTINVLATKSNSEVLNATG